MKNKTILAIISILIITFGALSMLQVVYAAAAARCTSSPCTANPVCSRYSAPPEAGAPNTIDGCNDGGSAIPGFPCGAGASPSVEQITVRELVTANNQFDEGELVNVTAKIFCSGAHPWKIFYANNELAPVWVQIGGGNCAPPQQYIATTTTLASPGVTRYHSFRVVLGNAIIGTCASTPNVQGDADDISIQVNVTLPVVSCSLSGTGWTFPSGAANSSLTTSESILINNNGTVPLDITGQITSASESNWMYTSQPSTSGKFEFLYSLWPFGSSLTHNRTTVAYASSSNYNNISMRLAPQNSTAPLKLFVNVPNLYAKNYNATYEITCAQSTGSASGVVIIPNPVGGVSGTLVSINMLNATSTSDPAVTFDDLIFVDSAGTRFDAAELFFSPGALTNSFSVPSGAQGTGYLMAVGTSTSGLKESAYAQFIIT